MGIESASCAVALNEVFENFIRSMFLREHWRECDIYKFLHLSLLHRLRNSGWRACDYSRILKSLVITGVCIDACMCLVMEFESSLGYFRGRGRRKLEILGRMGSNRRESSSCEERASMTSPMPLECSQCVNS